MLVGSGNISFQDNKADTGAALYILSDSFLLLNFSSFQFRIINNFANAYGGTIFIDCLLSNATIYGQCHWLLYCHDNLCRDNLHYISNCRVRISTNVYCSNFLRKSTSSNVKHIDC